MADVHQVLLEATQQLNETLNALNEILEEAGSSNLTSDVPIDRVVVDDDGDDAPADNQTLVPKPSPFVGQTWWIAGAGITTLAIGAGVYLYARNDDGFSLSTIKDRIMTIIGDRSSERLGLAASDDDFGGDDNNDVGMTVLERLGAAATFAANLILSSVVTSIGEKAREYVDVEAYVEAAQERVMEVVKEPLESLQNVVDDQIHAVQNSIESQVQAAQDVVQSQVRAAQETVQDAVCSIQDGIAGQIDDAKTQIGGIAGSMMIDDADRSDAGEGGERLSSSSGNDDSDDSDHDGL